MSNGLKISFGFASEFALNKFKGVKNFSFRQGYDNSVIPSVGDIVQIARHEKLSFVVMERKWTYREDAAPEVVIVLEFNSEENSRPILSVVK